MPKKDSSKPRGRITAYAFFMQICREEHKRRHPTDAVVFAEFSKKCGERWKTMSEKEKKRFQELADRDKQRYDHEMQSYIPPAGAVAGGKGRGGKKPKKQKDPNAPKRALSAFFWFCNDERGKIKEQNPEYGLGDVAKELGKMWADVQPELKRHYEQKSEMDKQRYAMDIAAYKAQPQQSYGEQEDEEEYDDDDD